MDCIDKIEFVALDFLSLFDKGTRFDHSHHFLPGFKHESFLPSRTCGAYWFWNMLDSECRILVVHPSLVDPMTYGLWSGDEKQCPKARFRMLRSSSGEPVGPFLNCSIHPNPLSRVLNTKNWIFDSNTSKKGSKIWKKHHVFGRCVCSFWMALIQGMCESWYDGMTVYVSISVYILLTLCF